MSKVKGEEVKSETHEKIATDNTPDIITYEFLEIDQAELQKIWDPNQNPAY